MASMRTETQIEYNQCQETVIRLTDYLSHELVQEEEAMIAHHLDVCRGCFSKFHFEETLLRTIRERVHDVKAPESLRTRILRLIDKPGDLETTAPG